MQLQVYTVPDTDVNRTDKMSYEEAMKQEFVPVELGKSFGPSWASHWFKGTKLLHSSKFKFTLPSLKNSRENEFTLSGTTLLKLYCFVMVYRFKRFMEVLEMTEEKNTSSLLVPKEEKLWSLLLRW